MTVSYAGPGCVIWLDSGPVFPSGDAFDNSGLIVFVAQTNAHNDNQNES